MLVAVQLMSFGLLASLFGARELYWPATPRLARLRERFSIDNGCIAGGSMVALGVVGAIAALASWAGAGFSDMNPDMLMRVSIPSVLLAGVGL